jgi:hypothetical protein
LLSGLYIDGSTRIEVADVVWCPSLEDWGKVGFGGYDEDIGPTRVKL